MNSENNVYVVKTIKPPSYIKILTNNDEDVILVHSKIKNIEHIDDLTMPLSPEKESYLENSLLDITGSPLKCNLNETSLIFEPELNKYQNSWTKEEEFHYPLTLEQARNYLNEETTELVDTSKVVWCVCDGLDKDKTVLIACDQSPSVFRRNIVKLHGYLPEKDKDVYLGQIYKAHNEIKKSHEEKKESCLFYEFVGSPINESKDIKTQTSGYVTLEIYEGWYNKMLLNVQTLVGHPDAASIHLWENLLLLKQYVDILNECDGTDHGFKLPTSQYSIDDDLMLLVTRILNDVEFQQPQDEEGGTDILRAVKRIRDHADYDVTDRLWNVLVHCNTYGVLVDCLNAFLTEVTYNRGGNIYISRNNESWPAELLRGLLAGVLPVPTFTGTQPIQFLLMLGIEKLRKDYVFIFNVANVADEIQINSYLNYSEENTGTYFRKGLVLQDMQLASTGWLAHEMMVLGRMETLCELFCLVPFEWLRYVTDIAKQQFLGPDSPITSFNTLLNNSRMYRLEATLPARAMQQKIDKLPTRISHKVETSGPGRHMASILLLSLRPVFPPCIYSTAPPTDHTAADIGESCYHYTTLRQLTNFFGKQH